MILKFICNGVKDDSINEKKTITLQSTEETVSGSVSIKAAYGTPASVSFEVGKEYNINFTAVVAE